MQSAGLFLFLWPPPHVCFKRLHARRHVPRLWSGKRCLDLRW
jgi:hypothetical protein